MKPIKENFSFFSQIRKYFTWGILIILIICLCCGCRAESVSPHVKNGKTYGTTQNAFRSRWWNFYERGLSFTEGEFYQKAAADLKEALSQRSEDRRMARTYGMHFVDYFPHRELGIIYYQTGDWESAKKELEISLEQFPSAKAWFYLDQVRKKIIERLAKPVAPPVLTLNMKTMEGVLRTRDDLVIISGDVRDGTYVSSVTINNIPLFLEGAQQHISFQKPITLSQGKHDVEIAAQNLSGKTARQTLTIYVDRQGPVITIEQIAPSSAETINISGSVYDESGIGEFRLGDKLINIPNQQEIFFNETLKTPGNELIFRTSDQLGNQTLAHLPMNAETDSTSASASRKLLSSLVSDASAFAFADFFKSEEHKAHDDQPPVITLKGWTDTQTVFMEKIYLEGMVRDESNITRILVNGTPVLRRKGKYVFFSHLAELDAGSNEIVIKAADEAGNNAIKTISVIRKIPEALRLDVRLSTTVLPFSQHEDISPFSFSFQDNLIHALVSQNRFRLIERDKLDVILQEQKLSQTRLIDRDTALNTGRLAAARSIITGNIIETRSGIEIVARMIDTETGEILSTTDVYDEAKDLMTLQRLSEGMAVKFHRDFPLLTGAVVRQKGNYIFTDLGENKVKVQRRVIVYREDPIEHPLTGKRLGADNIIMGQARIIQVMPNLSKAEMVKGNSETIRLLDRVITE